MKVSNHFRQKNIRTNFSLYVLLFLSLSFCSCERRELTYYEVSEISVHADWSKSGLDEEESNYGATIVFYPRGGGEPIVFLLGDRSGSVIRLPEGVYDAVLFNRSFNDFSNIAFRGTNGYAMLEAYARKVEMRRDDETRTETRTIASSPDGIAAATIEGFTVTEDMLGNYSQTGYGRLKPLLLLKEKKKRAETASPSALFPAS